MNRSDRQKCAICSGRQFPVHHVFSSKYLLKLVGKGGQDPVEYQCPSCKVSHPSQGPEERVKILFSNSMLHQYWLPNRGESNGVLYEGDEVHVDHVTIPWGLIKELCLAFVQEYGDETRGLYVLLLAGTDDILDGQVRGDEKVPFSGDRIVADIRKFKETVLDQARANHPEKLNSFGVISLPCPPSLCHLPDEGPLPYADFIDHYEMMKWINKEIKVINRETQQARVPTFHHLGHRTDNIKVVDKYGGQTIRHTRTFRMKEWKGDTVDEKLYLCHKVKMKMGRQVVKYFVTNC